MEESISRIDVSISFFLDWRLDQRSWRSSVAIVETEKVRGYATYLVELFPCSNDLESDGKMRQKFRLQWGAKARCEAQMDQEFDARQ